MITTADLFTVMEAIRDACPNCRQHYGLPLNVNHGPRPCALCVPHPKHIDKLREHAATRVRNLGGEES